MFQSKKKGYVACVVFRELMKCHASQSITYIFSFHVLLLGTVYKVQYLKHGVTKHLLKYSPGKHLREVVFLKEDSFAVDKGVLCIIKDVDLVKPLNVFRHEAGFYFKWIFILFSFLQCANINYHILN